MNCCINFEGYLMKITVIKVELQLKFNVFVKYDMFILVDIYQKGLRIMTVSHLFALFTPSCLQKIVAISCNI